MPCRSRSRFQEKQKQKQNIPKKETVLQNTTWMDKRDYCTVDDHCHCTVLISLCSTQKRKENQVVNTAQQQSASAGVSSSRQHVFSRVFRLCSIRRVMARGLPHNHVDNKPTTSSNISTASTDLLSSFAEDTPSTQRQCPMYIFAVALKSHSRATLLHTPMSRALLQCAVQPAMR